MSQKIIVLDSSAFIMGYDPLTSEDRQFTTPSVGEELKAESVVSLRFKTAFETGRLELLTPSFKAMEFVDSVAAETGDIEKLSKVDREVLALAEELRRRGLKPVIISDDYSIQNVADRLEIKYAPLSNIGIRHRFQWIKYCPSCRRKYPSNSPAKICRVCGAPLKRRPLKKALSKRRH